LRNAHLGATVGGSPNPTAVTSRRAREVFFQTTGLVSADVLQFDALEMGAVVEGPVLIEAPFTTIVIDPGACVTRTASGSLVITP